MAEPARTASSATTGEIEMSRPWITGTRTSDSACWMIATRIRVSSAAPGDCVRATRIMMIPAMIGPAIGIRSMINRINVTIVVAIASASAVLKAMLPVELNSPEVSAP